MRVTGVVVQIGTPDILFEPHGSSVVVLADGASVGNAIVGADHRFERELDDGVDGQLELRSSMQGAAPVVYETGDDVDLVVGTHRLLSEDVEFKDLGLVIVDEAAQLPVELVESPA